MKITNVEVFKFFPKKAAADDKWNTWPIAKPISAYEDFFKAKNLDIQDLVAGACVVKITAEDGTYGLGSTGLYRESASFLDECLKPHLLGLDALEIEYVWDIMYKTCCAYGRTGLLIHAISAIDIALWDLYGKLIKQPVYQLLGGKVRDKIKAYATGPDFQLYHDMGYKAAKIPMPYGAMHGKEGLKKNIETLEYVAGIMGSDAELMLDCWMSWDTDYTIQIAKELQNFNVRWVEEPTMPDDYDGYKRCREILNKKGILVSGGEHEFTRWGARKLVEWGCVDILQCDVGYAGGISELRKINAYAKAHDVKLIPHSNSIPTLHFSIASTNSPFAETLMHKNVSSLFTNQPEVKDGYIDLPDTPGFGYEIDWNYGPHYKYEDGKYIYDDKFRANLKDGLMVNVGIPTDDNKYVRGNE
ncbi:MAG: L-rhamnonate dehydratase [Christensenellaceae bacterium]|nr:L-rhamnonate dehydratase [Christensenellaceae bacterium]